MPRQKRSAPTATPRVRPVPRSPRGRTRFAHVVVYTRQPNGSPVERRRTRHALTFTGDPIRFIAAFEDAVAIAYLNENANWAEENEHV